MSHHHEIPGLFGLAESFLRHGESRDLYKNVLSRVRNNPKVGFVGQETPWAHILHVGPVKPTLNPEELRDFAEDIKYNIGIPPENWTDFDLQDDGALVLAQYNYHVPSPLVEQYHSPYDGSVITVRGGSRVPPTFVRLYPNALIAQFITSHQKDPATHLMGHMLSKDILELAHEGPQAFLSAMMERK